ncbi:hypothetical protein pdam_00012599 [Pocillopora damicornis]|uniref:G-protein coupled receptors family 2 profile 2 domain-containing protein n=1 Tax=Pocillopora damicornis TaxID=46731 RepID=A0A3M6U1A7_POCDA|nr:hypothetical protein pdam_00012599 [Pocillopora damicornis]
MMSRLNLPYYAGHLFLLIIVTAPTLFYVFRPDHPPHSDLYESNFTRTNQTSSNKDIPLECNSPLIPDNDTGQCRPPCAWTSQSSLTQKVYYGIVVIGLWLVVIATIITLITWASIESLRKFPHVLRFHIIICCIFLACFKMIPVRIGLEKVFCGEQAFWQAGGHPSLYAVILGAGSHYFILAHSFWAMCFIANTYAVIIHDNRAVFKHPIKIHLMQSVLSWLVPAFIVAGCLYFAPPGYTFLFMDHMSAGAQSIQMAYFTFTLPMQVTIYVSLHLLWSIVWHLRKARLDATKRVIRAREEKVSMRRIERQFLSMAVVILVVAATVTSINTMTFYRTDKFVHGAEMYFHCLQLCGEPLRKPRADTELSKDSRCSSVLTVLSPDRRGSELYGSQTLVDPKNRILPSYPLPRSVPPSPNELDPRSRSSSVPVILQQESETASTENKQGRVTSHILSTLSRDLEVSRSMNSEDSDANSETDKFIPKSEETSSPS